MKNARYTTREDTCCRNYQYTCVSVTDTRSHGNSVLRVLWLDTYGTQLVKQVICLNETAPE